MRSKPYTYIHSYTYYNGHPNAFTYSHPIPFRNSSPESNAYFDSYSNSGSERDTDTDGGAQSHAYPHSYSLYPWVWFELEPNAVIARSCSQQTRLTNSARLETSSRPGPIR